MQADYYRQKAREIRAVAVFMSPGSSRAQLLRLAKSYDKLANLADQATVYQAHNGLDRDRQRPGSRLE